MSEPRGRLWNASWPEYLGEHDRWSNTSLKKMSEEGARAALLVQTGKLKSEGTAATRVGTVSHTAIWEGPDAFAAQYLVADRRTKKGKESAEKAEAEGKSVITAKEYGTAMGIAEGVVKAAKERAADGDSFLADLLAAPGLREQSFVWEDEETGLPLKGRADKWLEQVPLIVDLKTAKSWRPEWESWLRDARKYGYHRQAWMYCDAYKAIYGKAPRFIHIVVHSEPPYEVGVYELGESELELGMNESRRAMRRVLECLESGQWFDPAERGVVKVCYPHFVFQDEEMSDVG